LFDNKFNRFNGVNATIFAYGMTGSGKTYTINGSDGIDSLGIIPQAIRTILEKVETASKDLISTVTASYLEIYQEKIYDLLVPERSVMDFLLSIFFYFTSFFFNFIYGNKKLQLISSIINIIPYSLYYFLKIRINKLWN